MTRTWVLIAAASAALCAIALLTRHFREAPSTGVPHGSERTVRSGPGAAVEPSNSGVGWTAKSGPGSESGSGRAALSGDSIGKPANSADARGGESLPGAGGPTVVSGGSRSGTTIGTGRGTVRDGADALRVQGSVSVAPLIDKAGPLTGGTRLGAGQQQQGTHEVVAEPAPGSDPSKSDATDDQGPVVSIPFDKSTVPEKGDAPVVEHDIAFDGQGATFSTDSQYAIPDAGNLTGDAGTISFCLRPQWGGDETNTDASLVNLRTPYTFENRLQITKNGQYLRFLIADNTGHEAGAGMNISPWQAGQNHLVTTTWGEALTSLYVDGQLVGSQTYEGQLQFAPGTPMYVGSDLPGGIPGARSSLANFQVYNRPLAADEVGNLTSNCQ